jgi:predicted RNA-binding Zn-ribbon protein involved in translation (DUF1610 family)
VNNETKVNTVKIGGREINVTEAVHVFHKFPGLATASMEATLLHIAFIIGPDAPSPRVPDDAATVEELAIAMSPPEDSITPEGLIFRTWGNAPAWLRDHRRQFVRRILAHLNTRASRPTEQAANPKPDVRAEAEPSRDNQIVGPPCPDCGNPTQLNRSVTKPHVCGSCPWKGNAEAEPSLPGGTHESAEYAALSGQIKALRGRIEQVDLSRKADNIAQTAINQNFSQWMKKIEKSPRPPSRGKATKRTAKKGRGK